MPRSLTPDCFHAELMSVCEDRHTDASDKVQLLVITSAAIKALHTIPQPGHSIPQLGLNGWHLDLHPDRLHGCDPQPSQLRNTPHCMCCHGTYLLREHVICQGSERKRSLPGCREDCTFVHYFGQSAGYGTQYVHTHPPGTAGVPLLCRLPGPL